MKGKKKKEKKEETEKFEIEVHARMNYPRLSDIREMAIELKHIQKECGCNRCTLFVEP